jgi:hypothetical protein
MSGIFDQIINYAPPSLLLGTVTYKGTWSAATNTPTLVDPTSSITNGNYYVVDAAGTQFTLVFNIGDWIISNGSTWEKVDNTDAISSVFGRTGAVVGVSTDYSSVGITNTALGASNPSTVAATTVTATSTIAATGAVTGSNLSGTNTGDQTISLTGGVTGSGTGSFAATVVTNADLTGDVTSVGNATTLTNAPVIAKVLTGYSSGAGTVAATDSILQAIQKLDGNDSTNADLTGVITSSGNATSIASQTGTGTKFVVDTSPTLVTPNIGVATGTSLAAALNGSLGATTPSTVAATTITGVDQLSVRVDADTVAKFRSIGTYGAKVLWENIGVDAFTIEMPANTGDLSFKKSGTTQVALLTSTGLNSTAIGATTPAQGNFTFLYQGTSAAQGLGAGFSGAAGQGFTLRDTTNSRTYYVTTETATGLQINAGANPITLLGNTAITGTLSASGESTLTGRVTTAGGFTATATLPTVVASSANFDYNSTGSNGRLIVWGPDVSTSGNLTINLARSDGSNFVTPVSVSSTGAAITGTLSATGAITGSTISTTQGTTTPSKFGRDDLTSQFVSIWHNASGGHVEQGGTVAKDLYLSNASGGSYMYLGASSAATTVAISATGLAITGTLSNGQQITTVADAAYANAFNATNGNFRIYPYVNATDGVLGVAYNAGYAGYGPLSFEASTIRIKPAGSLVGLFSSTGLAVTGAITSTGGLGSTYAANVVNGLELKDTTDTSGAEFAAFRRANATRIGGIARVGTTDAVVYNTSSDARLKTNIRDFTDSGRLIDALQPRMYDWKSGGEDVIGFVAQEEHAADPVFSRIGAVTVGDDDPTTITKQWQRSDAALIPILVAELQSLRIRLAALESK